MSAVVEEAWRRRLSLDYGWGPPANAPFGRFLHILGKAPTDGCPHCGTGVVEDTEHLLLSCPHHRPTREEFFDETKNGVAPASILFDRPARLIGFLRRIGRLSDGPSCGAPPN